jgi:hypothetical protein
MSATPQMLSLLCTKTLQLARISFRGAATSLFLMLAALGGKASAQAQSAADDVAQGRELALTICGNCHIVARDQPNRPILRQPVPSFISIAQHNTLDPDWLKSFLTSTHRGSDNPQGMPSPELIDKHAVQIIAYLLSLRTGAVRFPAWDVGPSCRGAADAGYVTQSGDQLKSCVEREQRARQQLEHAWSKYTVLDRNECMESIKWFEPTYSELATCLEMRAQVSNGAKKDTSDHK